MMTEKDLIDLGKNKVRNNKDLLALFKGFFRESFGRDARCTGCSGFKDFDLLREKYYPQKKRTLMQVTKYKVLYPRQKVLSYLKNGKVYRTRVTGLSDEFLDDFMRYGNEKVYPNFRKMILPIEKPKPEVKEPEPIAEEKPIPKPRAKKKRSPKKKKDE